jgi:hypothetical protein
MKEQVTDPQFLASIRPDDMQLYLHARGWQPIAATIPTEAVDWEMATGDTSIEVTVAKNVRWRDYPRRVREVLAALSQLEGRSEREIAQDIQRASGESGDIVRVRDVSDGRMDGSIPAEDGLARTK